MNQFGCVGRETEPIMGGVEIECQAFQWEDAAHYNARRRA